MTSHYTWRSMTTLHGLGGALGRPLDTFFWVLTISWSSALGLCGTWPLLLFFFHYKMGDTFWGHPKWKSCKFLFKNYVGHNKLVIYAMLNTWAYTRMWKFWTINMNSPFLLVNLPLTMVELCGWGSWGWNSQSLLTHMLATWEILWGTLPMRISTLKTLG